MPKKEMIAILILCTVIAFAVLYHYVFHIYEIDYNVSNRIIYADNTSSTSIEVIPVNSWGFKAPLRSVKADFQFEEGKELIDIVLCDSLNGKIILKAKDTKGKVVLKISSVYSLFPGLIEIEILPNSA